MENKLALLCLLTGGIVIRALVSLHPYSGYDNPPMYGDFEAQRHWQEVTVNLPIADWYTNTTDNDLMYWGLDYPPLTAYHSWLMGQIGKHFFNPKYVALHKSRGLTDVGHKTYMRNTVLFVDLFLYIPAMILAMQALCHYYREEGKLRVPELLCIIVAVFYPGQIIIDNGHFQYNNVSLGLATMAIVSIFQDRNIMAAIFFVLSLNYKQMELYHSLPFFFYLLGKCGEPITAEETKYTGAPKRYAPGVIRALLAVLEIGFVVIMVFVMLWAPWLRSFDHVLQVLHRLFPVARGVFEDKVANVWCVVNVFVKLK